jgi:YggT family protein
MTITTIEGWNGQAVLIMSLYRFLNWIIYGFIALLIIEAIFSWVNPQAPLAPFVRALNDPLLRPIRRVVPLIGGIDLSVLVALILLQIAQMIVGRLLF